MNPDNDVQRRYLKPGDIVVERYENVVLTVLGSCIAVCLWDPVSRIGGINHFMLPYWNGEGLPSPKYGNIAIEKLRDKMLGLGCLKADIKAKVFGGGAVIKTTGGLLDVGNRNTTLAFEMLAEYGIPVISKDVLGSFGRKIAFNTSTGEVHLKRIQQVLIPTAGQD